ncbi:MAG: bifunctional lysine ketoglutarate reductase /saccharopine dehydrogenase family protein [Hyphomicrobiales bacterium]
MKKVLGIRHEDKYAMECRVPITPSHLKKLIQHQGIKAIVEPSHKRVFPEQEFQDAGASVNSDLSEAEVIMGVKEMPISFFEESKTYIFFSHVIKGQTYNMPMLKIMMEKKCNLIDYEKITDDEGRRLIFFGRFAGLAGMINSLWSLGQRWKVEGYSNPFDELSQSHKYSSLEKACEAVKLSGERLSKEGLPERKTPIIIGFTGYGNVSKGAQEIANLLPGEFLNPEELLKIDTAALDPKKVYKVVFKEEDMFIPKEEASFDLQEYYNHPERYKSVFYKYLPHLSVLMNCMYWATEYPRIATLDNLKDLYKSQSPVKLSVIGDITCDPDGSIQCTYKGTPIEEPVFTYNPIADKYDDGFHGEGLLIMAVDILPSELPRESSEAFSKALYSYVDNLLSVDYNMTFSELPLLAPIKRAMILHKGKLTPDYMYLSKFVNDTCDVN